MPVAAVTRLRARGFAKLPWLLAAFLPGYLQALKAPGSLLVEARFSRGLHLWTLTVWEDRAAMEAFVDSPRHRAAAARIGQLCRDAAMAHWEIDVLDGVTWEVAERYLKADGRRPRGLGRPD